MILIDTDLASDLLDALRIANESVRHVPETIRTRKYAIAIKKIRLALAPEAEREFADEPSMLLRRQA